MKPFRRPICVLRRFDHEEHKAHSKRVEVAKLIVALCFCIIFAQLWYLQVVKSGEFRARSEKNRLREIRLSAPRGKILDRAGRLLAGVAPCFNVCIVKDEVKDLEGLLKRLAPLLKEPEAKMRTQLAKGFKKPRYMPIVIKRRVDWDTLCRIEAASYRLPGVYIETTPDRRYPYGIVAPHLIGYLGQVTEDDLRSNRYSQVRSGDLVGKSGVEAMYQDRLAGRNGMRRIEVDATNGLVKVLDEVPPVPGDDLYLTIDLDLQRAAQQALGDQVGAVVVMDPQSGAIMAMASTPGFDPELFVRGMSAKQWKALQDKVKTPLVNRAIQGLYAPGSTFKIVTAAAALQEKIITPYTTFYCSSRFRLGRRVFRCWDWRGHGKTNLYKAISQSCDVYFYQVGLKLGIDEIAKYAKAFGLGSKTEIPLPNESRGLVPTRQWKKSRFHEPWLKGETLVVAIGQGYTQVTPIQMARLISAVANGGILYRPLYIHQIMSPNGKILSSFQKQEQGKVHVHPKYLRAIKRGLVEAVNDRRGTGKACKIKGLLVAGKTGTAQVIKQAKRRQSEKMAWKYRDHAWFIAYAPADKPQIAVAVLVEHGGHGGSAAAPIAKKIFKAWLKIRSPRPAPVPQRTASIVILEGAEGV